MGSKHQRRNQGECLQTISIEGLHSKRFTGALKLWEATSAASRFEKAASSFLIILYFNFQEF